MQGHAVAVAAHAPFQQSTGVSCGHFALHFDESVTQSCSAAAALVPSALLQRYGVADGHGQPVVLAAQLKSQHRTGVAVGQVALQSDALVVHSVVPLHRIGVCGEQGHRAELATQLLSQHCTIDDGQPVQRVSDAAHSPLLGHVTCPFAQRETHVPLKYVHELFDAHCSDDVAALHATAVVLTQAPMLRSDRVHSQAAFSSLLHASSVTRPSQGTTGAHCLDVAFQKHVSG